jgi:hypothetical protein
VLCLDVTRVEGIGDRAFTDSFSDSLLSSRSTQINLVRMCRRRLSPDTLKFVPESLISASDSRSLYTRPDLERVRNVVLSRNDVTCSLSKKGCDDNLPCHVSKFIPLRFNEVIMSRRVAHLFISSISSYIPTYGQSASLSWCQAHISDSRPIFFSFFLQLFLDSYGFVDVGRPL